MEIPSRLRLRHLRVFLEVARQDSMTAAAGTLHVTQPALSKAIRELEDIVGASLFDRTHRRMVLSEAGHRFRVHAARIERDLDRATRAARGAVERTGLTLGVLPTAATNLVPSAAHTFARSHPTCVLDITTGGNAALMAGLRDGTLDLVVGRMAPPDDMAGLLFEQLYPEEIIAVVRPGHPLLASAETDIAALEAWPLIVPPPAALIAPPVRSWLTSVGLGDVDGTLRTVSLAVGRGAVLGSDAIWFISLGVVAFELRHRHLARLPLSKPIFAGPLGVSRRDDGADGPEMRAFRDCLQTTARALRGQI